MSTALVRAAVLKNYREVALGVGLNPVEMLHGVGLGAGVLGDPERLMPLTSALQLLENSAERSGCPSFGLRMAETRQIADFGAVSLLLNHQRNLRDALLTTNEYRHLLNQTLAVDIEISGKTTVIREEVMTEAGIPKRQATELAIGVLYRMCGSLLGRQWNPHSVSFSHSMIADRQDYRRVFQCKLVFDAEFNGIVCNTSDLDLPNPKADPTLANYARTFMESVAAAHEQSVVFDVRKAIYLLMPMGRATVEQTAQGLGLSVRTLQRNLDEAGVTFSELLNGVRCELVLRYISNKKYSLQRVGMLLGYAAPSSFTRWFCGEFGASPRAWRSNQEGCRGDSGEFESHLSRH